MDSLQVSRSPLDDVFRLVADRQRRLILRHLIHASTDQSSIDELADQLIDTSLANRPTSRETVLSQLQHKDLPALEQYGVIEYDSRTGAIRYHPDEQIEALLECLPDG